MNQLKQIVKLEIPYWINKRLGIHFYYKTNGKKKVIQVSVWKYHKDKELKGYENEWLSNWWKHYIIWKNY